MAEVERELSENPLRHPDHLGENHHRLLAERRKDERCRWDWKKLETSSSSDDPPLDQGAAE